MKKYPRRGPTMLPALRDKLVAGGYTGNVLLLKGKKLEIIAIAKGRNLQEMRRRKWRIYQSLKDAWMEGQGRLKEGECWQSFIASKGHIVARHKTQGVRLFTMREWKSLPES